MTSRLALQLAYFFKKNMKGVCLEETSPLYIDHDRIKLQVKPRGTVVPFTPSPNDPPQVHLLEINLTIIWNPHSPRSQTELEENGLGSQPALDLDYVQNCEVEADVVDPFASSFNLPQEKAWSNILEKFATGHLIKRYPLIFGEWKINNENDSARHPSISRSIISMLSLSNNKALRSQAKKTFKCAQRERERSVDEAWDALGNLATRSGPPMFGPGELRDIRASLPSPKSQRRNQESVDEEEDEEDDQRISFAKALNDAMSTLYKARVKHTRGIKLKPILYARVLGADEDSDYEGSTVAIDDDNTMDILEVNSSSDLMDLDSDLGDTNQSHDDKHPTNFIHSPTSSPSPHFDSSTLIFLDSPPNTPQSIPVPTSPSTSWDSLSQQSHLLDHCHGDEDVDIDDIILPDLIPDEGSPCPSPVLSATHCYTSNVLFGIEDLDDELVYIDDDEERWNADAGAEAGLDNICTIDVATTRDPEWWL